MTGYGPAYLHGNLHFPYLDVAPLRQRVPYLPIALWWSSQYKAYKKQEVYSFSLRNNVPSPGISSPFYKLALGYLL